MSETRSDQFILFIVAGTTYALPSESVAHVEMVEEVTRVPNAPPFVDGVVVPRTVLIVFEIVLVLAAIAALIFSRAGLLAWFARSRDGARGPELLLGVAW